LAVHADIELLLVGRSVDLSYEQGLRNLVRELGMDERVHFLGHRRDVSNLHSVMDGIVLTSYGESLSNAVLEGMASGLPVITSDCGGMRDAVQDGVNGWLVPRDQDFVKRLAGAIEEWAADPFRRKEYGAASRRIVEERFSLTQMVQGHIRLYESLLREDV
jgi:glycosyltransferase involved in cell wall biosynthesis